MIDKEYEVYTRVREKVLEAFPNASIDSSYQPTPSDFPHIAFYQIDEYATPELLDNSLIPKFHTITFEAQVHSNLTKKKNEEAKKIMNVICETMARMNFTLISKTPVPNINDSSIYRLAARFEGTADENSFYRR